MTLEATEKGIPKAPASTHTDGLNAYRSAPWMPPDASAAKPNLVENGQLVIPSLNADTAAKTTPAADTKTATTQTTPTDTTQTQAAQADAGLRAAITSQGAIADPGDAVPMWMRMTNNRGLDKLIQQQYGESALNGFQKGVTVPGVDAPGGTSSDTADNSADTAAAILNDTAAGGGTAAA
jgi:hypothetical protein